jgi:single-strand DNA-binding protein
MAYNEKSPRDVQPEQTEKRRSLPSVNRVTLVGNTGGDREMRTTKDGRLFATFDVAATESWLDPDTRERRERVDFHKVGVYRKGLVSLAEGWLGKGSRVYIDGQLRNSRWVDVNGQTHTNTEVAVTPRKGEMIIFSAKLPAENPEAGQSRAQRPRTEGARQEATRAGNWDAAGRRASRTVGEPTPPRTTPNRRKP